MKRTLQWRKILNTLAIGLALLLLGMIFGGILQYGWDKETMRITVTTDEKKADSKNTTGGAILETGTEASGKSYLKFDKQAVYQTDAVAPKTEKAELPPEEPKADGEVFEETAEKSDEAAVEEKKSDDESKE